MTDVTQANANSYAREKNTISWLIHSAIKTGLLNVSCPVAR